LGPGSPIEAERNRSRASARERRVERIRSLLSPAHLSCDRRVARDQSKSDSEIIRLCMVRFALSFSFISCTISTTRGHAASEYRRHHRAAQSQGERWK